jgi:hypothetical protein
VKFAYADPPYFGQGRKLYQRPEWDTLAEHARLIAWLQEQFPDGWVMSLSSPSLRHILPLCPEDARVAAWVKPFAVFKPNVNPAYAWEPVVFRGGRKGDRTRLTVRDWFSHVITLKKGLTGAKPEPVCEWFIQLLGAEKGDTFYDVFPGTGIFGQAWAKIDAA